MIKTFIQGNLKNDRTLFGLLGAAVVSPEVHDELGVPVTGEAGDVWIVDATSDKTAGFAQLRACKNGELHLRYLYAPRREMRERLLKAALDYADDEGATNIYTNARKTDTLWTKHGFVISGARRGTFVRWEQSIQAARKVA